MYVHVKSFDGKRKITLTTSRLTTVGAFKKLVQTELNVRPADQRLFFRGKQLENGYSLFDYDVNVNDVIQLMIISENRGSTEREKEPFHGFREGFRGFDSETEPPSKKSRLEPDQEDESGFRGFAEEELSDSMARVDKILSSHHFTSTALSSQPSTSNNSSPSSTSRVDRQKNKKPPAESRYFRVGDAVDVRDNESGSWFEGRVVDILLDEDKTDFDRTDAADDGLLYSIQLLRFPEDEPNTLKIGDMRWRARDTMDIKEVKQGDKVMVNYNVEEPRKVGYWYDLEVKSTEPLVGTLLVGSDNVRLENTKITQLLHRLYTIPPRPLLSDCTQSDLDLLSQEPSFRREYAAYCSKCNDSPTVKCKECSCNVCGGKDDPGKQVMCDECSMVFHLWCLSPPLDSLPDADYWYCGDCKNDENEIVRAGGKLKESKKKAKMASAVNKSARDWGKGMACVGRTKQCTIVPPNHFGPIPGIEVGTSWKFRVQVSEAGVHRPHVAGIAGRENDGAYSIVFSGGYEGDRDEGEEFLYTGSGGRDLSGNKRTAEQSSDQTLTRMNKALALNCNTAVNDEKGAEAENWKGGKPVRVVRNYKAHKHSKYSPVEGNRYDGIYKVVKYFPEVGSSGYVVWRFLLRRDDPAPPPWTKEGEQRMASLGLKLLFPDGYLEAMEAKERKEREKEKSNGGRRKSSGKILSDKSNDDGGVSSQDESKLEEKPDPTGPAYTEYKLTEEESRLIQMDTVNDKLWTLAKESLPFGKQRFLSKVEEVFMCVCCQEVLYRPVTTPCSHNICQDCLKRSMAAEVYSCPWCRNELGRDKEWCCNQALQDVLSHLFPGYSSGR